SSQPRVVRPLAVLVLVVAAVLAEQAVLLRVDGRLHGQVEARRPPVVVLEHDLLGNALLPAEERQHRLYVPLGEAGGGTVGNRLLSLDRLELLVLVADDDLVVVLLMDEVIEDPLALHEPGEEVEVRLLILDDVLPLRMALLELDLVVLAGE